MRLGYRAGLPEARRAMQGLARLDLRPARPNVSSRRHEPGAVKSGFAPSAREQLLVAVSSIAAR